MKKAAIDIGTNTVLLLIAEKGESGIRVIEEQQRVPRLGQNVDEQQNLSEDAMRRAIDILKEYQELTIKKYPGAGSPVVTATSAVRDANNRTGFLERVERQTGLKVIVLSGKEEAVLTFLGAQSVLSKRSQEQSRLVLDIGGGSTEIAFGKDTEIKDRFSFNMGCVRFTERFLNDIPPAKGQIATCKKAVQDMLAEHLFDFPLKTKLIGVAGTVTSLAVIDQDLEGDRSERINGCRLSLDAIRKYLQKFSSATPAELVNRYPLVMKGRADIFLAGMIILEGVMNRYNFKSLTVSTGGIRHGAVLFENSLKNKKGPDHYC